MRPLIATLTFFTIAGCNMNPNNGVTAAEARAAANEHMAMHLPEVDLGERTIETIEQSDRWRVSYDFPGGATGGPIILEVSKASGEVINGSIDQ